MEPDLQINQIPSHDENYRSYKVTVNRGEELIQTEEDLLMYLQGAVLKDKEIHEIVQISYSVWQVYTHK